MQWVNVLKSSLVLILGVQHLLGAEEPIKVPVKEPAKEIIAKINAHLVLQDGQGALEQAKKAIALYPHSKNAHQAYIKALFFRASASSSLRPFVEQETEKYFTQFPPAVDEQSREFFEWLAWQVIEEGLQSTSYINNYIALVAAFLSQDAKGVKIVLKMMDHPQHAVRQIAAKGAAFLPDHVIQERILIALEKEKQHAVILELIESAGKLKIEKAGPILKKRLQSNGCAKGSAKEQAVIIEALANIYDKVDVNLLTSLFNSPFVAERRLACKLCFEWESVESIDKVQGLLKDPSQEVRIEAVIVLGRLALLQKRPFILQNFDSPQVAKLWQQTLFSSSSVEEWREVLYEPGLKEQIKAACLLAGTGEQGREIQLQALQWPLPQIVKLNIALGILKWASHKDSEKALAIISSVLAGKRERLYLTSWMEFPCIVPESEIEGEITDHGDLEAFETRLHLINLLASHGSPDAYRQAEAFLEDGDFSKLGSIGSLLFVEGDESAFDLFKSLLKSKSVDVQIEAALMLALVSHDPEVLKILESSYVRADRELKERVLEAMGSIRSPESIPFLVQELLSQHSVTRLIAASSLLNCLN